MDYKKKLKQRLYVNLGWAGIGALFILFWCIRQPENTYPLSLGIAFVIMGVIRTIQYRQTVKDEQALRQKELAETDERNLPMRRILEKLNFTEIKRFKKIVLPDTTEKNFIKYEKSHLK